MVPGKSGDRALQVRTVQMSSHSVRRTGFPIHGSNVSSLEEVAVSLLTGNLYEGRTKHGKLVSPVCARSTTFESVD